MKKLFFCLSVVIMCLAMSAGNANALRCDQIDPMTGSCVVYKPDLLPGAHDCSPSYVPATDEIAIFTDVFFHGFCQAFPVTSDFPDLAPSGWYGNFQIKSIKIGSAGASHNYLYGNANYLAPPSLLLAPGRDYLNVSQINARSLLTVNF